MNVILLLCRFISAIFSCCLRTSPDSVILALEYRISGWKRILPLTLTTLQVVLDIIDGIAPTDAFFTTPILALRVQQLIAESTEIGLL